MGRQIVSELIIGAGIGGLAAGAACKQNGENFLICESQPMLPRNLNNGVHYLHTDNLYLPFNFDLKEVKATEEIWNPRKDEFKKEANLPDMIDYSLKIMKMRHPSSIMDPGTRKWGVYLPQDNDMNSLLEAYEKFIGPGNFRYSYALKKIDTAAHIAYFVDLSTNKAEEISYDFMVTTAPLPAMLQMKESVLERSQMFKSAPTFITNYKMDNIVPNWMISLYVSDHSFPPHRITALNGILSLESLEELSTDDEAITYYHLSRYFDYDVNTKTNHTWQSGRIWGLTKEQRTKIVEELLADDIVPIGRFGLWNGKMQMHSTINQAEEVVAFITKNKTSKTKSLLDEEMDKILLKESF